MFPVFLEDFLNDVYWGENFNNLLRSNDQKLARHIDPLMDVRRSHAPGTVTKLALRDEGFAFTQWDDFLFTPAIPKEVKFVFVAADCNPCMLNFNQGNKVYYQLLHELPEVISDLDVFTTETVELADPVVLTIAVYVSNA